MYSLKLAHLLKEQTGAEVYNFYIDMRDAGKGYEEFYDSCSNEGMHFIRGRVAEVTDWAATPEEEGKLVIRVEDTLIGTCGASRWTWSSSPSAWSRRPTRRTSAGCSTSPARPRASSWSAIPSWPR